MRPNAYFRIGLLVFTLSQGGVLTQSFAGVAPGDYTSVGNVKEKKIEAIRLQEIRAVKTALSLRNPENRKAELYLRLAELYLEAYRADFLLEGRLHEKELAQNPNAKFQRGRSMDDLKYGIGAAEMILSLNVDKSKLDQVYYFLGYNYGELHDSKKSLAYYKKLAKEFPDSPYASEGIRAVADEAFQAGDYPEAQKQYEAALKRTQDPSQQARILHKLAWCYYRSRRTNEAVTTMKKAIEIAKSGGDKLISIREEGLRDLAVYYAETGRVDEAIAYFKENAGGEDKLARVLEKLGKEYERTGQTDKAKLVYDALLKLDQKDESSLRVAAKLVDLDIMKQNFQAAYERLKVIEIPKSIDTDTQLALANLRRQVRSTAIFNHDRYRKMDDKDEVKKYLLVADQFYSIYLSKFLPADQATRAERNEVRMYLAEVKHELNEPGQAAELYKKIIQDKDEKYAKEAAQLWVGSLASELKNRASSGEKPGSTPSDLEKDFVDASDLLQASIPDSVESREARLRSAQILAAYPGEKSIAISRAASLAKEAPSTPQGLLAARLWLQLDPNKATLASLSQSQALLEQDKKAKNELSQDLESTAKKIRVGEISSLEKSNDFGSAAKGYEEFARNAKSEKEAESAYLGALNAYAQAGKSDEVARVMKEWKSKFPKSALVEKSVKSQATLFFIRGLFNDSAELFLGIGRQLKDYSSYLTSAALFDGGLQRAKARNVYKMAQALAPNDEERAKVFRLAAYVAADQKDDLAALNDWKSCFQLNSSLKAECGSQVGNYYLHLNDTRLAQSTFDEVVRIKSGPASKSPYIAYAQFRIAQGLEKGMRNQELAFPEDRLLRAFTARVEELKPVSDAYQKAINFGGPWGIAATERLGDLALALSGEVERVLKQKDATAQLKQALSPVAQQLKQKALQNAKDAYRRASKEELLSSALPVIQDRLVDAGADGMVRAQGPHAGIKLIGISPEGGKDGLESALKEVRGKLLANQTNALAWIDYGNLLWGTGKPGLSRVAYERSSALKTRGADALNNLAVVMVSDLGFENWFAANEAVALWKKALTLESNNSAALFNLGHFFNYYRLFEKALPYFEKVIRNVSVAEAHDGLAVSEWAVGRKGESELDFRKAELMGSKPNRFARKFVEAASKQGKECLSSLDDLNTKELRGFEKISESLLRRRCSP
ncbi:MAG: tetratricopeptide repeat protein [Bdellovibrionales bacterium]|nr:tetratricopeptide repeat protein [Oligoflexia bacterium]